MKVSSLVLKIAAAVFGMAACVCLILGHLELLTTYAEELVEKLNERKLGRTTCCDDEFEDWDV